MSRDVLGIIFSLLECGLGQRHSLDVAIDYCIGAVTTQYIVGIIVNFTMNMNVLGTAEMSHLAPSCQWMYLEP